MRLKDIVIAQENKLPILLADGSRWLVVDVGIYSLPDGVACYTTKPYRLFPLDGQNGGQPKSVGESEIVGFAPEAEAAEEPPFKVTGFSRCTPRCSATPPEYPHPCFFHLWPGRVL